MKQNLVTKLVAVSAAAFVMTMAGCSSGSTNSAAGPQSQPPGSGIDKIGVVEAARKLLPAGTTSITIALTDQTPPSGFIGTDGKTVVGIDADMAVLLGQALGVEVKTVATPFDQIIPGIEAGRYDMTIAAMSPTKPRMKVLNFVDYFRTGSNIAVPKGNPNKLSLKTLCGQTVAVLKGSVQEGKIVPGLSKECTDQGKAAITVQAFPNQQETVLAVTSGRVAASAQSAPPIAWAKMQGAAIDMGQQDKWTTVALGVHNTKPELLKAVATATQAILDSKSYHQVLSKWGVDDFGVSEAKINNVTY